MDAIFFDTVVTAYDAGAHEPDSAPFHRAEKRLPADNYAMIGDDVDIEGARNVGWTTCEYHGQGLATSPLP